jgi:two-component system chemotaxis sensor kinase CheA
MDKKAMANQGFIRNLMTSGTFDALPIEELRRVFILNSFLLIGGPFLMAYAALIFIEGNIFISISTFSIGVIIIINFFYLRYSLNRIFVSYFVTTTMLLFFFMLYVTGGSLGSAALWMYPFPLIAVFLVGAKSGLIFSLAMIVMAIIAYLTPDFMVAEYSADFIKRLLGAFAVVSLFAYVYEYLRDNTQQRLTNTAEKLSLAKKETDNILATVNEGLFLLSTDLKIGTQHSSELQRIFEEKELANKSVFDLLTGKVTEKTLNSSRDFFQLLLREEVEEETLQELNPLSEVEYLVEGENRVWSKTKYLTFDFNRIIIDNQIEAIFASVRDRTEQVELEKQLKKKEEQTKQQMELFMSILHVDPTMLSDFMDMAEREMISIDTELKRETRPEEYENLLNGIFQSMHNIKGNAGLIDLEFIASKAHEFENAISKIRDKKELSAASFSPLILLFGDINTVFGELKSIVHKVNKFQITLQDKRQTIAKMLIRTLDGYIRRLGGELEKEVELNAHDFIPESIPLNHITMVKDVLIQLVRNAVFHGIENPDDREKAGKARKGKITLATKDVDGNVEITLLDDGAGLDLEKLKAKALEIGKYSKEELDSWDQSKIAQLIFEPGISTSEATVMAGGRGVGMNVIKEEVFRSGGKIKMRYATGKYFEFKIILPLTTDSEIM